MIERAGRILRRAGILIAGLLALGLGGCSTLPVADGGGDPEAKEFRAAPGRGVIYLYRHERFAAGKPMPVYLDGRFMGDTRGRTYFRWSVEPGKYQLRSTAEGNEGITLQVEGGAIYYVWQEIRMTDDGLRARLHQVSPDRGRDGVMQCNRLTARVPWAGRGAG